jgi:hypothetical protein
MWPSPDVRVRKDIYRRGANTGYDRAGVKSEIETWVGKKIFKFLECNMSPEIASIAHRIVK